MNGWPQEQIPDEERLFMRVHKSLLVDGELVPGVFREQKGSISTDWERYSTPQQSLARAAKPAENGIIALLTEGVRSVPPLNVVHEPRPALNNRAHTNIYGLSQPPPEAKNERRLKLLEMFHEWELRPEGI